MEEFKFYVYKTTNLVNGKIYIGVHQSQDVDSDLYIGSGKRLKSAIKKYGKENFERDIIEVFDNKDEAFAYERSLVDEDFISRSDTYNIVTGGGGSGTLKGEEHPNYGLPMPQGIKDKISKSVSAFYSDFDYPEERREVYRKARKKYIDSIGGTHPEEVKRRISEGLTRWHSDDNNIHPMLGRKQTEDSKNKMSKSKVELWKRQPHPMLGSPRKDETKNKISQSLKSKPKATCEHCGKYGYEWAMKRYHFDNCKFKLSGD